MKSIKDNGKRNVALLMVCAMIIGLFPMGVFAGSTSGLQTSGGTTIYNTNGGSVYIDQNISIGYAENISEASVMIRDVKSGDSLHYSTVHGITGAYNSATGILNLTGTTTPANYQNALRSVEFSTTSSNTDNRIIDFVLGSGLYYEGTGHFYEYVYTGASISWQNAKTAAEARSFYGRSGYLVTITSAEENAFVLDKAQGIGWIGARDINRDITGGGFVSGDLSNGDWRWVTGPEGLENNGYGRSFFRGYYPSSNPQSVAGVYHNWATVEPNNYSSVEWVAHIYGKNSTTPGEWNDFSPTNATVSGYIVEYGGMSGDSSINIQASKSIAIQQLSISNIAAPAPITTGSKLTLTTPTVTGTPTSQGWQYSSNEISGWENFVPSNQTLSVSENGYYLRYYATSGAGTVYSNTVQITVNKFTPALSLSATPTVAIYPTNVVLTATLTNADNLSGKAVKFYNGAAQLAEVVTNSSGIATHTVNSPGAAAYSFRAEFAEDANNVGAVSSSLSFSVSKGTQTTVAFADSGDISKTYGNSTFILPAVSGGSGTGDYSYRSSNEEVATVSGDTVTISGAGEAIIYVKKLGDVNYNESNEAFVKIIVLPKPLIVTPSLGQHKYYGQGDPALSYSTGGAVSGQTPLISGSLIRTSGEGIANYPIDLGTLALSDNEPFKASNYQLVLGEERTFEIKEYTTAAVATATPNGDDSWFKVAPITLSAPAGYLISASNALIDNTWTNSITLHAEDGNNKTATYYLRKQSGENAGAISTSKVFNYKVDTTAPTDLVASYDAINTGTLAQIGNFLSFGNFFKEGINITISATDATSGLAKLYYTLKQSDGTTLLEETSVNFSNGNATIMINFNVVKDYKDLTIKVYATDIAGNKTEVKTLEGNYVSDKWTFENINPVIGNFNVSGNDITANQWFNNASVSFTSAITDDAGIYTVSYKIDGAATYTEITTGLGKDGVSATSYDFSQVVTGEGTHTVELLVIDNAMNASTKGIAFQIDAVAPEIASVTGNASAWQNTNVTLTVHASDGGSGLAVNAYSFDGGVNWQLANTNVYSANQTIAANTIMVKDAVGNIQSYSSEISISKIDKTNPDSPTVMLNASTPDTGWYTVHPTIEITSPTHVAATAPETTYYKLWNTSAATNNTEPAGGTVLAGQPVISADGIWNLKTWTIDEAGNTSTPATITIRVDTTTPDGNINIEENSVKTFLNTITFGLFFNRTVDVNVTAVDATSEVVKIEYYRSTDILDPQAIEDLTSWTQYAGTITETVVDATRFIYYVKITDHADNVTYFASNGATFDTINPAISGITNDAVYYVDQAVTVNDTNLDTITLNGSPFASGQKITGNTVATYTVSATDKAGNNTTVAVTTLPIASLSASINSLSIDHVKSSDKLAIALVVARVEAVLLTTTNGASQVQIDELNAILDQGNALLVKIAAVKQAGLDAYNPVKDITTDNVIKTDRPALEQALDNLKNILEKDITNLTYAESQAFEDQIDSIKIVLNTLDQVAELEELIGALPNPTKVTKADTNAIAKANENYEKLTDHQKTIVDAALKTKLNQVINALKKVLLLDAPTGTRLEGVDGTVFDLRTELIVTPVKNTLDLSTMRTFALGVSRVAPGQQIVQLYDIKLMLDGRAIQPDGKVRITLTLTDEQSSYTNLQIVFIADDGTTTIIPSTINGNEISFITDHFSYYAIIGTAVEKANSITKTGETTPAFQLRALALLSAALLLAVIRKRKLRELEK